MDKIIIRKMLTDDYISMQKNLFKDLPIEQVKANVENDVKSMKSVSSRWTYFVAECNGEVVGTLFLEHKKSSIRKHIGELYSIVVSEEYRKKGIAKMLLTEAVSYAKELKLEILILSVRSNTEAEIVYPKLGFINYGKIPNGIKDESGYCDETFYYYVL